MSSQPYPEVNPNPDFPAMEEKIIAFWEREKIFQKSIDQRQGCKEFVFYDGPPFANGLPHYGHLLTGYVKDVFARYQTMRGKRVERRFGWDCHGLPAEMGAEKELGLSGRQAIIQYGIGKFNEHCRNSVMKYAHEWERYVTRQARWVDFKHDYKTMDISFMESVLWAFKQLYDKGLVYEAYRVLPYSWAAETPLSNFETKLDNSYREREDKAITVAFELNQKPKGAPDAEKYYVLAWTTTPWTLPSNLALAVSNKIPYVWHIEGNKCYYATASAIDKLFGTQYMEMKSSLAEAIENPRHVVFGSNLIGLSYKPLFPYFADHPNSFRILDGSSFVTDTDGTGIVHMAPGFGEDDQKCCEANGIEIVVPVDGQGKYTDEIYDLPDLSLKGLNVIAEPGGSKFGLANDRIIDWLKKTGHLIKQETIKHNYPHCWRTDTPLIYRAMPSWYVEVTKFRERAVELNQRIHWIPAHVRDGQMGHMLATAPDWSISRNRFWGTPIPIWKSKSGKIKVFGSIAELEAASGQTITDLHRPYIDDIVIHENGEEYRRVEDVFDCWFESGSMPFAQVHYPFESKNWFEHHFPADFITEYVGQTRGWFNTLIMIATGIFDKEPFKNCICHGVVLDAETGLKYSKRLKNYKDPLEVIDQYGADALRWLMLASPVMRGQDLMVDPQGKFIRDVVRLAIKPVWNAYNFFCLYANADGMKGEFSTQSRDVMDRYILAKCRRAVEAIQAALDAYDTPAATEAVSQFFEALNNWYIRRNKERFWKSEKDADKQAAYDTLYTVLTTLCRAAAPLLPLTLEEIYRGLLPPLPPGEGRGEGTATPKDKIDPQLLSNARHLRENATDAEKLMWSVLRNRQLANAKFKRQQPIGHYIADFCCHEAKLIIELDGGQHAEQGNHDEKRTAFLEKEGYRVLRFWNNEVLQNLEGVLQVIYDYLQRHLDSPSPQPSPDGRGSVVSVHLADFPDVSAFPHDEALTEQMDFVRDVCNAALAIRNKNNIRVRLPLARLTIVGKEGFGHHKAQYEAIIRDEVNVKEIRYEPMTYDIARFKLKLDFKKLGQRLPDKVKTIIVAAKKPDRTSWKMEHHYYFPVEEEEAPPNAEILEAGTDITEPGWLFVADKDELHIVPQGWRVVADEFPKPIGDDILLEPDEYEIKLDIREDLSASAQALASNDALVILDTAVTPELEAEGIARDIVRMIQQARKDANLHVSDRICLYVGAPALLVRAIDAHQDYIMEQTLTEEWLPSPPAHPAYATENTLDDQKIIITLNKI